MRMITIGGQVTVVPAQDHITQTPTGKFNNQAYL